MHSNRPFSVLAVSLLFLALTFFVPTTHALKYIFDEESKVCFVEEITSDTRFITGRYNWHDRPSGAINLNLVLYGPGSVPMKTIEMKMGDNIFVIAVPINAVLGAYLLCAEISPVSSFRRIPTGTPIAVSFDVDQSYASVVDSPTQGSGNGKEKARRTVDDMDIFSFRDVGGEMKAILRPKEYLEDLENSVEGILIQLRNVDRNIFYALNREGRMRLTSESTFTRVWITSLLTLGVMAVTVYAQFHALKTIIIKKKLV